MDQDIYRHLELDLRKNLFIFICLENKSSLNLKFRFEY